MAARMNQMTSLFRQEAIEAKRDRLSGAVIAATPPRSGVYFILLLLFVALIGLLLAFGQYPVRAQVRGIVAYNQGIARVFPNASGEIRAIHVREGMRVRAGTPLVTLSLAQGTDGLAPQINEMVTQDRELDQQQQLGDRMAAEEVAGLERQQANLSAAIASLERQRTLAADQVRLAEAESRRAAALAREGAGSQRQVEESRAQLLARRAEVESLTERIIAQQGNLQAARNRIAERRLEAGRSRSELAAQRAALAEQRSALTRQDTIVLTAPVDGVVEQLSAQPGQRAGPDAPLLAIVPEASRMEVWLYAPSRSAGLIQPGQEVSLLLDGFPHQSYGVGRGRIAQVDSVAVDPATLGKDIAAEEPLFRVRVAIDQLPEAARTAGRLRAGMTLTGNVILARRQLWEMLFNPFATALDG
jgi:membrane fusion protein